MDKSQPSVLDLLRRTYRSVLIPAVSAGKEIGLAEKTTRNMLSEGRFPLPTRKVSSKTVVSIFELAKYLDGGMLGWKPAETKRGRPTKASRFEPLEHRGAK